MLGWGNRALWSRWRNREREPGIPARRPVRRIELTKALQVQISLHLSDREKISDLGTDAEHVRLEAAEDRVTSGIVSNLLIGISNKANEDLFI